MKRIIIVNTYYQLIVAIHLKTTLFRNDYICCLISDHSNDSKKVFDRVVSKMIFDECHYIKTKGVKENRSLVEKLIDFISISFCKSNRYEYYLSNVVNKFYNEIICFNFYIDIYGLHSVLCRYNNTIKVSFFEEGILSYNIIQEDTTRRKIIKICRFIQNKPNVNYKNGNFYCFYPNLYNGGCNVIKIPKISQNSLTCKAISDIFEINTLNNNYNKKYIFFSSVYDFEGDYPIGEFDLICKVADIVGIKNLLIKKHPRDTRDVFEKNGFIVDSNSSIPWEAIQLSLDFNKSIFLTATSGSVLAGSLMCDNPVKTFYMFKQCNIDNNLLALKTVSNIKDLLNSDSMKGLLHNVKIAKEVKDILK